MVQEALLKEGFEIEKKKLDVPTHEIKMTGTYHIVAHLYENDKATITLNVLSEAEVKAAQKKAAEEARKAAEEEAKAKAEAEAKAAEEAAAAEAPAEAETEAPAEA